MNDSPGTSPAHNARGSLPVQPGEILVDARGHQCPVPTLRLHKALQAAGPGQRLRLLADDPMARIDVPHFLASKGYPAAQVSAEDGWSVFIVETPA